MESADGQLKPSRPPLGIYASRCDEKGRLRLPKEFEEYMRSLPVKEFFVTSLDGGNLGRIYDIDTWYHNEKILEDFEDPEVAEAIAYSAHYYGAVSTIDGQARVLVPPDLRRKLGIENAPVKVRFFNGGIDIFSEAKHEERLAKANEAAPAGLRELKKKGLR